MPISTLGCPGGSYPGHVPIDDRLTLMAIVMNKVGEHLRGVCVSCWGWQGHIFTPLCEDIRHREGIKQEGQRKRGMRRTKGREGRKRKREMRREKDEEREG